MKRELVQFGKSTQKRDLFDEKPILWNKTTSSITVEIFNDTPVTPFSNGSEAGDWDIRNCDECTKRDNCALYDRLTIAYLDSGKLPFKTVKRIGYSRLSVQHNGVFCDLTNCKEFVQATDTEEEEEEFIDPNQLALF